MALRAEERIVAGSRDDLLVVHHLRLRGSNRAIGRHLGEIARGRYGASPSPAADGDRAGARLAWLRERHPIAYDRLCGMAAAFGLRDQDGERALDALRPAAHLAGCGIAWLPARRVAGERPMVSRSFDAVLDAPGEGVPPAACPYVLELHPDDGHASLAMVARDFLGAVEGVNAEGLVVAMAADEETPREPGAGATGLDAPELVRHLLDTCATAAEARDALDGAERRPGSEPAVLVVADRRGDAFAYEPAAPRADRVVEASGRPLVVTNHPPRRYPDGAGLPREDGPGGTYARYRRLRSALAALAAPCALADVRALGARGFAEGPPATSLRTLWHSVYDPEARALEASFLLRDGPAAARGGAGEGARTRYLAFRLAG